MHLQPYASPHIPFNHIRLANPTDVLSVVAWIVQVGRTRNFAITGVRTVDSIRARVEMPNGRQRSVTKLGFSLLI